MEQTALEGIERRGREQIDRESIRRDDRDSSRDPAEQGGTDRRSVSSSAASIAAVYSRARSGLRGFPTRSWKPVQARSMAKRSSELERVGDDPDAREQSGGGHSEEREGARGARPRKEAAVGRPDGGQHGERENAGRDLRPAEPLGEPLDPDSDSLDDGGGARATRVRLTVPRLACNSRRRPATSATDLEGATSAVIEQKGRPRRAPRFVQPVG